MNPKETLKTPCKYHMKVYVYIYIVKYLWGVAHVLRVNLVVPFMGNSRCPLRKSPRFVWGQVTSKDLFTIYILHIKEPAYCVFFEITHYKNSYIIYHNWSSFTIIYHHSFTIIMLLPHLLIPLGLTHGTDRGFPRWSNKTPRPPVRLPTPSEAARLKKLRRKTWRSRW